MFKAVEKDIIFNANKSFTEIVDKDYDYFCERISRLNINLESLKEKVSSFNVALPSWGVGTGGTRFARFPGIGEPQNIFEKIEDCAVINDLVGITSSVSPHFPWDDVDDYPALRQFTESYGINFDIVNSNTFQDPAGSKGSFKYGSLTHIDQSVREQAIKMNIDCIEKGITLGSKGLTVWIADGGNFPGQQNFSKSLERYVSSMQSIYTKLPEDWMILLEHKPYEPAFYSTIINDWGTSYICAKELGEKAMCLVDLGHHLPNTNIEMIVSRLIGLKKLGGFHFNDSKFGDDDLDSGSINPFELFLIFNELTNANKLGKLNNIAYMIDQSHNVTDPIESLILSANEIINAYAKSLLVDYQLLRDAQNCNDVIKSSQILKEAYNIDVNPLCQMIRMEKKHAIDPISVYRSLHYKENKSKIRKNDSGSSSGIV